MKSEKKKLDMLNGSLADKIIYFVLPLALTGILQQLFNAADVAVVGQLVNADAMGAVGTNTPVVGLFVNLFIGISIGTNVVIARFIGSGETGAIEKTIHTAITFSLLFGVILAIASQFFVSPLLQAMGVPENIFPMALSYIRIYMGGVFVIILYNFEAAIFRSNGDTKTPLVCLIISGICNVCLNVMFIKVFNMTADGVALATVISNGISAVILFVLLLKRTDYLRLSIKKLRIHTDVLKPMLLIGVPAGLQSMVFSFSNIIIQSAINSLGGIVVAASAAAFNVEIMPYFLLNAFGQAATTFIGQNHGANNIERCKRVTKICIIEVTLSCIIFQVGLFLLSGPVLSIFNSDPRIIEYGTIRLAYILLPGILNCIIEVLSGSMRGYGHSLTPAIMTFVGICGFRIIWIYTAFPVAPTFETILVAYPVSWAITMVCLVIAYLKFTRSLNKPHYS